MFSRSNPEILIDALNENFSFEPHEFLPEDADTGKTRTKTPSRSFSSISDDILVPLSDDAQFVLQPRYGFPAPDDTDIVRLETQWKQRLGDKIQLEGLKAWREFLHSNGSNRSNNKPKQLQQMIRKYGIPACFRPKVSNIFTIYNQCRFGLRFVVLIKN
jgi:hypothetical protein